MLTDVQRDVVKYWVRDALADKETPRSWLRTYLGNEFIVALPYDLTTPDEYASRTIALCEADGWNHNPPWLIRLLRGLPEVVEIKNIIDHLEAETLPAIPAPPPVGVDPFEDYILFRGRPFLNRLRLRDGLRGLVDTGGECIFVVNGPPKSGKTYSGRFINHLSRKLEQEFEMILVTLEAGDGLGLGPDGLARDIVYGMTGNLAGMPPQQASTPNRWVKELSGWICAEAIQTKRKWWIVLDGFSDPDLSLETRKMIQELAKRITIGLARKHIRLVLLDYHEPFPYDLRFDVESETISSVEHIGEVDVRNYFTRLYPTLGRPYDQGMIDDTVSIVLDELPATSERLCQLGERLYEVTHELRED